MGEHLPDNKKYRLTIAVLEGHSYAEAGRLFNVPRQTAMDVAKKYFPRVFPLLYEREKLGINLNDLNSLRRGWRMISCH